jgi:hypothetical protein
MFLKNNTGNLALEFISLIKTQKKIPQKIIIICTHFGLAYQLGSIKKELEKTLKTKLYLIVQITDDSPQYIWYVDTADLIIAPSQKTVDELKKYGTSEKLQKVPFKVLPYPVLSRFADSLSDSKLLIRQRQYNPNHHSPINIMVPISGAAVGMEFFINLMEKLHQFSTRFVFFVICRKAPFTQKFIERI